MIKSCDGCGVEFEAKRSSRKFHDATCRQRARRRNQSTEATAETKPPDVDSWLIAVETELREAKRLDSIIGQQAYRLAVAMCSPMHTGSALAALSKEFRAVMAEAMRDVVRNKKPDGVVDQLKERRVKKQRAATR